MATVNYDDIILKIGSQASTKGIEDAVESLKSLGKTFDQAGVNGIKEAAKAMADFANAVNSMDKNVVSALTKIKGSITKVATAAQKATSTVAKAQKAEAPKLNADKGAIREALEKNYNPSISVMKGMGFDPQAVREVKEEMRVAKAEANEFQKFLAEAEKSISNSERILAEQTAKAEAQAAEEARKKAIQEAAATAELEKQKAEMKALVDNSPWEDMLRDRDDLMDNYADTMEYNAPNDVSDWVSPTQQERIDSIRKSLEYLDRQIEADRRIAGKHPEDADFGKTVEDYASKVKAFSAILAEAMDGDIDKFKGELGEIEPVVRSLAEEYAKITRSSGIAFGETSAQVQTVTISLNHAEKAVDEVALKFNEVSNAEDGASEAAKKFQQDYQKALETLRDVPTTDKSYMVKHMGLDPDAVDEARQTIKAMNAEQKRHNEELKEQARAAKEAADAEKELRAAESTQKEKKSPLEKLGNRISNFLQYRLMRAVFSGIVNGAKQGVANLEQWDRTIGNTGFADSMDRGREALEALKNSLAVIAAPGLEFVIKLLVQIAKWAITAANAISRFFAILGGSDKYVAVEWPQYTAETAAGIGKATDEAKEFKRQLMGFDEINNLTESGGGGSGGGGGGGSSGFSEMFSKKTVGELTETDKKLKKIIADFKNLNVAILDSQKNTQATSDAFNEFFGISEFLEKVRQKWIEMNKRVLFSQKTMDQTAEKFNIVGKIILQALVAPFKVFVELVKAAIKAVGALGEYIATTFQNVKDLLTGKINLNQFKENMKEAGDSLKKNMGDALDDLNKGLHNAFDTKWQLDVNGKLILNEVDVSGLGSSYFKITKYALGGYPNTGSLFIAGESGPEMVGTIGGSTAVANNDDIVAAVSQGVASAVASVLGNGTNVNVVLEGDARNLFRVVQNQARNYAIQTGSYAFG